MVFIPDRLFVLSFFPRGDLDEILNLIESVSEGFPSYSYFSRTGFGHLFTPTNYNPFLTEKNLVRI